MTAPKTRRQLHRCISCGRVLHDPISVRRGLGPNCWRARNPTPPRAAPTPGRHDSRAGPGELEGAGQLAFAIQPALPTGDPT